MSVSAYAELGCEKFHGGVFDYYHTIHLWEVSLLIVGVKLILTSHKKLFHLRVTPLIKRILCSKSEVIYILEFPRQSAIK